MQSVEGFQSSFSVAISDDGLFVRAYRLMRMPQDGDYVLMAQESCLSPGQYVVASATNEGTDSEETSEWQEDDNLVARLLDDPKAAFVDPISHGASVLAGISELDGMRLSDCVAMSARREISKDEIDGKPVARLEFDVSGLGWYRFWIDAETKLVVKMEIEKSRPSDWFLRGAFHPAMKIGQRDETGWFRDSILVAYDRFEYMKHRGEWVVSRFSGERVDRSGDLITESRFDVSVVDVGKFRISDPERAEFEKIEIPDRPMVQVNEKPGLSYVLVDGRVTRVVDAATVETVDGVRFRKRKSNWFRFFILATVALAISLIWGFVRYRQRSQK